MERKIIIATHSYDQPKSFIKGGKVVRINYDFYRSKKEEYPNNYIEAIKWFCKNESPDVGQKYIIIDIKKEILDSLVLKRIPFIVYIQTNSPEFRKDRTKLDELYEYTRGLHMPIVSSEVPLKGLLYTDINVYNYFLSKIEDCERYCLLKS